MTAFGRKLPITKSGYWPSLPINSRVLFGQLRMVGSDEVGSLSILESLVRSCFLC